MFLDEILTGDKKKTIDKDGLLEVTNKTVKLKNDVFQFRNVTGFGVGNVKTQKIPYSFIFFTALFAWFAPDIMNVLGIVFASWIIWIIVAGMVIFNLSRPELYGLALYLNSGDERIFITEDMEFLSKVVRVLKEFMEEPKKGKVINITIGRDFKGNITFGDSYEKN